MPELLYAQMLTCEKALIEKDGALSCIRLAEIFSIQPEPPLGLSLSDGVIRFMAVAMARFSEIDSNEHVAKIVLERPSGQLDSPGPQTFFFPAPVVEIPGGINMIAEISVAAKEFGLHQLHLEIDGARVARCLFTLQKGPEGVPLPGQSLPL